MANTLYDALFAPHEGSQRDFLRFADGTSLSHDAFLRQSARYAHALGAAGLRPGDRLALQLEKGVPILAAIAAAISTGVVFLPLNPAYTAEEVGYFLADAEARLFLCESRSMDGLRDTAARVGVAVATLDADDSGSFAELAKGLSLAFSPEPRDPEDLAALLYTSGTTGRSKGAMLSHGNLLSNARVLAEAWRFSASDVLLHALPIFHSHGLFVATNVALLAGCPMIFLPRFDADEVLRLLPQATVMMGVPTFYTRLLDCPGLERESAGHMRLFVSGSAPLLAETHRLWLERTGHRILERYGLTETNMNTSNPYDGDRRAGTVGQSLAGIEVRVCDVSGRPLPRGETGMIEVRGPNVFQGYWRQPDKTREELRPNGFFITGDLGVEDADGYFTIVGRAKDLVITGGFNVYPKEVEAALDACSGVFESAVFGVPHPDFGEAVLAVIVAEPGTAPDIEGITADLARRLAGFKRPKRIDVVQALPRNVMGKVQKNLLRDSYRDVFAGQEARKPRA